MKLLIYGAGAIGVTYGYLLSQAHEVDFLVRPPKAEEAGRGYRLIVQDLREKPKREWKQEYRPNIVTEVAAGYDAILVAVNCMQLDRVLPSLQETDADVIFMQNNWDIQGAVSPYLPPERWLPGFPSQVGGGRKGNQISVNIYGEGTVLGEANGQITDRLKKYGKAFADAGLNVELKTDMLHWMKVHYLQQSISAGAIAKAGGYDAFARSFKAVQEMVYAFREGIRVCEACGVPTKNIFPAKMFRYPAPVVTLLMKGMFGQEDTRAMVTGHMLQGFSEWKKGYYDVLEEGMRRGVPMPVWAHYRAYLEQ